MVGVASYVLRYWETQFPAMRPIRTAGGQRHYRQAEIDEALRVKALLHGEGLRIAAAKRRAAQSPDSKTAQVSEPVSGIVRATLLDALATLEKVLDDDEKDV